MQETQTKFCGRENPLEKGMTTHSSILAWEILWTEEPGALQFMVWQTITNSLLWIWKNQEYPPALRVSQAFMEKVCFIFIAVVIWFSLINVCVVGSCGGFVFDFIFFLWWCHSSCLEIINHVLLLRYPRKVTGKKNMMFFYLQSNSRLLPWPPLLLLQKRYWTQLEDLFWQSK